jgi:CubicO group peptidase (beta-lactamase class C family)
MKEDHVCRTFRYLFPALAALAVTLLPSIPMAQNSLDSTLGPYLSRYELPAIAAAVVQNGKVIASGAVGTRRAGAKIPVTINDRFHIGSDTKAMTALLAAMMVEEGKLRWDSTIGEIFPELLEKMDPRLRSVTLQQILSHTSGIPTDNEDIMGVYREAMSQDGNLDELRYWLVKQWSMRPLESDPGTKFAYSNMGYTIAGAAIERVGGKTWDELITERIFIPLTMETAGLGPQASPGKIDAPLGHAVIDGRVKAFLSGPNGDGPSLIGPAGIVHMSVLDFARWAGWNAGEGKRGPAIVKPETMRKLHTPVIGMPPKKDAAPGTPPGGRYALGWGELKVDWAPYPLSYHGGSNGMNLAHIWLDTKKDFAIVIVTNIGGQKANEALLDLVKKLYTDFAKSPQSSYSDPFAYCATVGTVDTPDERYSGTKMPDSLIEGMIRQGIVSADAPQEFQRNAVWRCMNKSVWVCHFGANLPCLEKADTTQVPTSGIEDYCKTYPTSKSIPAAVTGRATVYEWVCKDGKPEVLRQLFKIDPEGYMADFWHELTRNNSL